MKDEEKTRTKTKTGKKTATNRTFAQIICVAFISRKQIAKVLQTDCATLRRPQTRLDFGQLYPYLLFPLFLLIPQCRAERNKMERCVSGLIRCCWPRQLA